MSINDDNFVNYDFKSDDDAENKRMIYINYDEFIKLYPMSDTKIDCGASSTVYESGSEHAIKVIMFMCSIIRELNGYSILSHPCIIKPLAWSYRYKTPSEMLDKDSNKNENIIGYIVMAKGISLMSAYSKKLVTIEQIMSDTISAVKFMNSQGIIHADIKYTNMIYHEKSRRVMLIDMDFVRKATLNIDGKYYITGIAYTEGFRDPEYCIDQVNDCSTELYALGVCYYCIVTGKVIPDKGNLYSLHTGIKTVDWFLEKVMRLQNKRISIDDLLLDIPKELISTHKGIVHDEFSMSPHISNSQFLDPSYEEEYKKLLKLTIDVYPKNYYESETLFIILNLIKRGFKYLMYDQSELDTSCKISLQDSKIKSQSSVNKLFRYTCEQLAMCVQHDGYCSLKSCGEMPLNIMKSINCAVNTLTCWDFARSKEDLVYLLKDIVSLNNDYSHFTNNNCTTINDKSISVNSLIKLYNKTVISKTNQVNMLCSPRKKQIQPTILNVKLCFKEFSLLLLDQVDIRDKMSFVLHNREMLPHVLTKNAFSIFDDLILFKKLTKNVLDIICKFNWRRYDSKRLMYFNSIHPFASTDQIIEKELKNETIEEKTIRNNDMMVRYHENLKIRRAMHKK
jgi:serine/threonine protein kinase